MTTETQPIAGARGEPERAPAKLLNVKQVAAMLNASPRTVYRLADAGKLPRPLKLGNLVRWRADELRRWIEAGCPTVRSIKGGTR